MTEHMSQETYEALKQTIDLWEKALTPNVWFGTTDKNPLCRLHRTPRGCTVCPVAAAGRPECNGMPLTLYETINNRAEAINERIDFLCRLLPVDEYSTYENKRLIALSQEVVRSTEGGTPQDWEKLTRELEKLCDEFRRGINHREGASKL